MPNYEQFKQAWNSMWNAERRKYTEQYKNDSQFQQFAQQYSNEMKQVSNQWQNQNWVVDQTQWTNTQQSIPTNQNQNFDSGSNWGNQTNNSDLNNWFNNDTQKTENIQPSQDFDSSRLTNDQAQVSVKEWTAAQTWRPDYEANSEARDNEIVNNLNAYWNTNKSFFTDRETFNKNFEYDKRNDRQKALLDSFWKWKQDEAKASTYTNWESILKGVQSWDITPDIMWLLRQNNPEAYAQWQQAQEDEVKLRIANYTTPANPEDTAEMFMKLAEKLWITWWDPYQIYDNWVWRCEQLWVFSDTNRLNNLISEMESVKSERTAAISRTIKEWAWRKAQALINAEVAKTSALYDSRFADLQTEYNSIYNQRQQNLAIANQSATALQMQWQEDSRVFNNKLAWLGFANTTYQTRTLEQQTQNILNQQLLQNDISLLNQSKSNDLALYNQYATAKLNNQLNSELTDLSVEDPTQLRANLNNVLGQYFSTYWDIIQRSQPQVVEDVIAYAKEHWISVAQALKENFIEPLQNKQEYKNAIAKKYPSDTTWQTTWDYSIDENWKLKVNVKGTWNLNLTDLQKEALLANKKTYSWSWMSWAWLRNNNPWNIKDDSFWNVLWHDSKWFAIFATPEDWFDALVAKIKNIQSWWSSVYSANMSLYDFFAKYAPSSDNNNPKAYAESVAKQLWTTANATVWSVDATKFAAAIAKHDSWYNYSTYWNYRTDPTYWGVVWVNSNTNNIVSDPYQSVLWTTSKWAEINSWWWITALEKTFWSTQRMSDAERKELYESYGIDKQTYDKMEYNYAKYLEKTEWVKTLQESLARAEDLLKWNQDHQWRHTWMADIETAEKWYYSFLWYKWVTDAAEWKAKFDMLKNNETLNKFLDLKKNNASFWQMSEWEWALIWNATSALNWNTQDEAFESTLKSLIKTYKEQLDKLWWVYNKTNEEIIADTYFSWAYNTWFNNTLSWVTNFIINW